MAQKQVSVRISAQGGDKMKADLVQIGQVGERSFGQIERASRSANGNLQNAAFQVQDFFVQVGAGTAPTTALAQQLPQLLGSMGLVGVLAGTAVAAIVPLGAAFLGARDDAAELEEALKALDGAVSSLESANRRASTSFTDLRASYGANADAARELFAIQRELAQMQADRAFGEAARNVGAAFSGGGTAAELGRNAAALAAATAEAELLAAEFERIEANIDSVSEAEQLALQQRAIANRLALTELNNYREGLEEIVEAFDITENAAAQLAVQAARVAEADTTSDRLDAARELAEAIFSQTDGLRNATDEGVALYSSLVDAVGAGLEIEALDIAGTIGAGADEAARLAENLARVEGIRRDQARNAEVIFDPRDPRYDPQRANMARMGMEPNRNVFRDDIPSASGSGRGGGGGGGASASNDMMREAQRLFEQTRTDAERYANEQQRINELLRAGAINGETYQRAIEMIGEKYKGAGDGARFFEDLTGDLKDAFLDLAINGENSFDVIANAIKRAALEALIFGSGPLGGMLGGGIFSFFGSTGKGTGTLGLPSFDGGGSTGWGSRSGGLDGKGGFMAMLHPQETVVDHTKGGNVASRGGTVVQINNYSGQPVQEQRERGPNGEDLIRVEVGKQIAGGDHDRAMRRFGARPTAVKR